MAVRLTQLAAQRAVAGLTVTGLASKANVSDLLIQELEALHPVTNASTSGTTDEYIASRIADALGVSLASLGILRL